MSRAVSNPYEIRSDKAVFEEIPDMKLPDQMIGLAESIIDLDLPQPRRAVRQGGTIPPARR